MQFGEAQLKRCKHGWMLFSGPIIGKCFELYGQYSEDEVRVFQAFIQPGDTVVDIGANIGDLTLPLSRCVGDTGRVYAVESHSDVFNMLCANLALNAIKNTLPINAFVSEDAYTDTSGPWGKYGYVSETWEPPFLTIDSLCLERCAFIKIDVDGKELDVLRSARGTIARTRPVIYLENDVREKSPGIFEFLMERGYKLYWHPAPIFEPENFLSNPDNHWAPQEIVSLMVVCIPDGRPLGPAAGLRPVAGLDDWWDFNV